MRARAFLRLLNSLVIYFFWRCDFGEDFFAVGVGVDLGPDLTTLPEGEMRKVSRLANFMSPSLGDGDAVRIDDLVVGIGEELEGEGVLGAPGLVAFDGVEADAEDDGVEASYLGGSRWKLWASMVQPVVWSLG